MVIKSIKLFLLWLVVFLSSFFCTAGLWIYKNFGEVSYEQILYHLQFGQQGIMSADHSLVTHFMVWCLGVPFVLSFCYIWREAVFHHRAYRFSVYIFFGRMIRQAMMTLKPVALWILTYLFHILVVMTFLVIMTRTLWFNHLKGALGLEVITIEESLTAPLDSTHDYFQFLKDCVIHQPCASSPSLPYRLIARSGGEWKGKPQTNSVEALNNSYSRGLRLLELDLDWTSDRHIVAIRGWGEASLYGYHPRQQLTLKEFTLAKRKDGLTQMSAQNIIDWFHQHPEAMLLASLKKETSQGIEYLIKLDPTAVNWIVPKIFAFSQYAPIKKLGVKHVIYSDALSERPINNVFQFAQLSKISAVMINEDQVWNITKSLAKNTPIYFYTINDCTNVNNYIMWGKATGGFVTDQLDLNACDGIDNIYKKQNAEIEHINGHGDRREF